MSILSPAWRDESEVPPAAGRKIALPGQPSKPRMNIFKSLNLKYYICDYFYPKHIIADSSKGSKFI